MNEWNCCRTCLNSESLNPIFQFPNISTEYTNVLFMVTGLKIEINDGMPQQLCTKCVDFINQYLDFRDTSQQAHKTLSEKLSCTNNDVTIDKENNISVTCVKVEVVSEDGSSNDMLDSDRLSCNKKVDGEMDSMEYITTVEELLKQRKQLVFENITYKKTYSNNMKNEPIIIEVPPEDSKEENISQGRIEDKTADNCLVECKYCHKQFKNKVSMFNHYKTHNGLKYVCEHCGRKFMTRRRLVMHCKAKHGYEKTDKCSYCEYRGSNPELVKIHERIHTGEKPFVCSTCGSGFHRRSTYLQHIAIHLPHKTVPCDECPALFKSVTLMRIHKNRHKVRRKKREMREKSASSSGTHHTSQPI
ncbi:zinc finger protein 717-like [Achroia grisella]|uniref:zinc finger protein 717-like n=1 Tax=Achroia grisella TaxID=688607 RepID=UPI0027D2877D|nr:zinc finger protein 717-like [Achroia grisella]